MQEARKITKPGAKSSSQYPQRNTIMPRKTIAKKKLFTNSYFTHFQPFCASFHFLFLCCQTIVCRLKNERKHMLLFMGL